MARVGVVGATGAVGRVLLDVLETRKFSVSELVPFASGRSVGKEVRFAGQAWKCRPLEAGCFDGLDWVFFDASDAVSRDWVPQAARAGAWVVDNSAAFRMDTDVPLLVPELNGHLIDRAWKQVHEGSAEDAAHARILTGPNCSTVQLVMALAPLHREFGMKRVIVSTYQSVSGAGAAAVEELRSQTAQALQGNFTAPKVLSHRIALNCIPQIGGFQADGFTSEEKKIREESRKILDLPSLRISATAVRVPTEQCHGESVSVEFERPVSVERAREVLATQPGVQVLDSPADLVYPLGVVGPGDAVSPGAGSDPVWVGRIRLDPAWDSGLAFWIISDNLRKGAALNAVQIAEAVLERKPR